MNRYNIQEYLDSRRGLPTEWKAVKNVAIYCTIPGAMVGMGLSLLFLEACDSELTLAMYMLAGAAVMSAISMTLLTLAYKLIGFWFVVRVSDALMGMYIGMCVSQMSIWAMDWVGLLAIPVGGVLAVIIGRMTGSKPISPATSEAEQNSTSNTDQKATTS
jgi:hypothetical protein